MYSRATAATILRWKPSGSGLPFESQRLRGAGGSEARGRTQDKSTKQGWARVRGREGRSSEGGAHYESPT